MNNAEHPTDAAVQRLPLTSDEQARLLSDPDAKQALFQEITAMPVATTQPTAAPMRPARPPRRRLVLGVTLASLSVAAVAGAVGMFASSSTSVGCHMPDGSLAVADAVTGDPVNDCAQLWQRSTGESAPPLVAYENGSGGIAVLPADEPAPEGWTRMNDGVVQDPSIIELRASLDDVAEGLPAQCRLLDDATQVVQSDLARLGLEGWSVVSDRGEADGTNTCTYFLLEPEERQVVLIPLSGIVAPADAPSAIYARDLVAALEQECLTVEQAARVANDLAVEAGLDPAAVVFHEVSDAAAACTRTDVNVGGSIEVTLRGPSA